jgi:hypothetical protein
MLKLLLLPHLPCYQFTRAFSHLELLSCRPSWWLLRLTGARWIEGDQLLDSEWQSKLLNVSHVIC